MITSWTPESLYEKLSRVKVDNPACTYTLERCRTLAPIINRILELKKQQNAIILAHTYVHPDIIYGVADYVGDSYGLAKKAMQTTADKIVFPSVRFMAETAKILNPDKVVLDPNPNGACSLSDSVTAEDVYRLRERYPGHLFLCYVNTTAAVKAACDISVTSSNVYTILERVPHKKILFLPDRLMGRNLQDYALQKGLEKEIVLYDGSCYVHEQFDPEAVEFIRQQHPGTTVIAHPECSPEVVRKADSVGSTTGMIDYVKRHNQPGKKFLLLTECGLTSRLQVEMPDVQLVGSCMMCKYMKSNSLHHIERVLSHPTANETIELDETIRLGALKSLQAMFQYGD